MLRTRVILYELRIPVDMRGLRGLSRLGKASASLVVGVGGCATLAPSLSRAEAVPVDAAPAQASTAALAGRTKQNVPLERSIVSEAESMRPAHLSIREVQDGGGAIAEPGMWVSVHFTAKLVGDGTIVEATRSSGLGDRAYGQPLRFQLGDLGSADVPRALHPAILNMRVGGRRRVRTSLLDPNWGYRETPKLYVRREIGERDWNLSRAAPRHVQGDWLVDLVVQLEDVSTEEPPGALALMVGEAKQWFRSIVR